MCTGIFKKKITNKECHINKNDKAQALKISLLENIIFYGTVMLQTFTCMIVHC